MTKPSKTKIPTVMAAYEEYYQRIFLKERKKARNEIEMKLK